MVIIISRARGHKYTHTYTFLDDKFLGTSQKLIWTNGSHAAYTVEQQNMSEFLAFLSIFLSQFYALENFNAFAIDIAKEIRGRPNSLHKYVFFSLALCIYFP